MAWKVETRISDFKRSFMNINKISVKYKGNNFKNGKKF